MSENHEGVLLDNQVGISEALIKTFRVLNTDVSARTSQCRQSGITHVVNQVTKANCDITQSDHDITSYDGVFAGLENFEQ